MGLPEVFSFIILLLKVGLIVFNKMQKTAPAERLAELVKLDSAVSKGETSGDLTDLSKWIGGHL